MLLDVRAAPLHPFSDARMAAISTQSHLRVCTSFNRQLMNTDIDQLATA